MRYMVFIIPGKSADYEAGAMPSEAEISTMMTFNEMLVNDGVMLAGDGFHPTSKAIRVTRTGETSTATDGPFQDPEIIGGYWMWKVDSKEHATELAKQCPLMEGDVLILRQCFDMEDFNLDPESDVVKQYDKLHEIVEARQGQ